MYTEDIDYSEKRPHVMVEGEWVSVDKTEFLNISEDLFGQDVMEFEYNGNVYSSHVVMRY